MSEKPSKGQPGPKAKSAPTQSNPPYAVTNDGRSFGITDTYVRNPQAKNVEALLKAAQINEDVKIVGPISIVSVV